MISFDAKRYSERLTALVEPVKSSMFSILTVAFCQGIAVPAAAGSRAFSRGVCFKAAPGDTNIMGDGKLGPPTSLRGEPAGGFCFLFHDF